MEKHYWLQQGSSDAENRIYLIVCFLFQKLFLILFFQIKKDMKKLILVRHAKSDWPEDTDDFDRPLADRGLEDAVNMSRFLKNKSVDIQKFVSSPALRAHNTSKIFNQVYQLDLALNDKLYHPSEENFLSVIYDLDDSVESVAFFSHNNGISNFANSMSEDIFHSDFEAAKKTLAFFYEPKNI